MKGWGVAAIVWLFASAALAQAIVPDRELEIVRQNFNVGNYRDALNRARNAMEIANFNDVQRVELHKYAGVSAFNLGEVPGAEKHFLALLQLNPDYVMDPFAYPPPAIRIFEEVKRKNADSLNLIRQQIALRDEQLRREAVEREKLRVLAEEARRRLELQAQEVTVRTIEHRAFMVNFIPFGAGQFQQGRTGFAVMFASIEAVLAITSMAAFVAIEQLYENKTYTYTDRIVPFSFTVRRIPEALKNTAENLKILKYASGGAFYGVWAVGVADSLVHHQDEVVTTEVKRLGPAPKAALPKLFLFPTAGGLGAGMSLTF